MRQYFICDAAACLGAATPGGGSYHHHVALTTWDSRGGSSAPPGHAGLYRAAILCPDRRALGPAVDHVPRLGHRMTGAIASGVSGTVYLDDPDGGGLELCDDRPREDWRLRIGQPTRDDAPLLEVSALVHAAG